MLQINGNQPSGDLHKRKIANSFLALADVAIDQLKKVGGKSVIVCGPMTTGGLRSVEKNLQIIEFANQYLRTRGYNVFNQIFFQETLRILKEEWKEENGITEDIYCSPILEEFYISVYASGLIYRAYFLPDWESSKGAKWEREKMPGFKIEIADFDRHLFSAFLDKIQRKPERSKSQCCLISN